MFVVATLTLELALKLALLQVQRGVNAQGPQISFLRGLRDIASNDGFRGLWRGAGARMAYTAPNTAITMALFDQARALLEARSQ